MTLLNSLHIYLFAFSRPWFLRHWAQWARLWCSTCCCLTGTWPEACSSSQPWPSSPPSSHASTTTRAPSPRSPRYWMSWQPSHRALPSSSGSSPQGLIRSSSVMGAMSLSPVSGGTCYNGNSWFIFNNNCCLFIAGTSYTQPTWKAIAMPCSEN